MAMDPIPALVRKLYDVWDVRMLVLLSLTLQIILFIFGKRRKYISSLWITVVVWSAYLLADWVATVALGKLSDASQVLQGIANHVKINNALQALWAPLLLIHLGGPDTITALALEDNTLWLRHLMGLLVQVVVAIYVILMSWGNSSWLSFLSLPALVSGIVKYGERTWALKSACEDESGNFVPFLEGDHKTSSSTGTGEEYGKYTSLEGDHKTSSSTGIDEESGKYTSEQQKYTRQQQVLILAHKLVKKFKQYMENYDLRRFEFQFEEGLDADEGYLLEAVEVEMGLMYDLMYTKATVIYSKAGFILRSISLGCTMSMLIGFVFWLITTLKHKDMAKVQVVDVAITGILLVGALALEIYAINVMLSSDWMTLWLLSINSDHRQQNSRGCFKSLIRLGKNYFTNNNKKKIYWSKMLGQFDLHNFWKKEDHMQLAAKMFSRTRILGLMFGNEKMHTTRVPIPSQFCSDILKQVRLLSSQIYDYDYNYSKSPVTTGTFDQDILIGYFVTANLYDGGGPGDDNNTTRETCKILSCYMMYLLLTSPSLLPVSLSGTQLQKCMKYLKVLIKKDDNDVHGIGEGKVIKPTNIIRDEEVDDNVLDYALVVAKRYPHIASDLIERKEEGWKKLENTWWRMLLYAATTGGQKNDHLQQLTHGGELLTFLWFLIPLSKIEPELGRTGKNLDLLFLNE